MVDGRFLLRYSPCRALSLGLGLCTSNSDVHVNSSGLVTMGLRIWIYHKSQVRPVLPVHRLALSTARYGRTSTTLMDGTHYAASVCPTQKALSEQGMQLWWVLHTPALQSRWVKEGPRMWRKCFLSLYIYHNPRVFLEFRMWWGRHEGYNFLFCPGCSTFKVGEAQTVEQSVFPPCLTNKWNRTGCTRY